jgi:hypothetical protein
MVRSRVRALLAGLSLAAAVHGTASADVLTDSVTDLVVADGVARVWIGADPEPYAFRLDGTDAPDQTPGEEGQVALERASWLFVIERQAFACAEVELHAVGGPSRRVVGVLPGRPLPFCVIG